MIASLSCATLPTTATPSNAATLAATNPTRTTCRIFVSRTLMPAPSGAARFHRHDMDESRPHPSRSRERACCRSAHRSRNMSFESRPLAQTLEPRLDPRQLRPLDRKRMPAMRPDAETDIGEGEFTPGNVVASGQLSLDHRPDVAAALARTLQHRRVALFRRRAKVAHE